MLQCFVTIDLTEKLHVKLYHSIALPLPTVFPPTDNGSGDGWRSWRLVGSLDMLDYKNQRCPSTWKPHVIKKACGRVSSTAGCDSVIVPTGSGAFRQICGRFRAFQLGSTDAFSARQPVTIDGPYVDGISITYYDEREYKRQHVFTYAAGLMEQYNLGNGPIASCPCAGGAQPPLFVRSADYYCESGNPDSNYYPVANGIFCDPLWDGKECRYREESCCTPPNQPWFCKDLFKRVSSDLEIRICIDQGIEDEDIAVESYELYVR